MLTPELIASTYTLLLLLAGCACLVRDIQQQSRFKGFALEPWKARLFDFAAFFVGMFALQMVGQGVAQLVMEAVAPDAANWPYRAVAQFMGAQLGALVLYAFVLRTYAAQGLSLNPAKLSPLAGLRAGGFFFLAALPLMTFTSLGWQFLLGWLRKLGWGIETPHQPLVEQLTALKGWEEWALVVLMAGIVAPVVEELVFRGALYRFLKGRVHPMLALAGSSLFFALMHLNLLQFVPLFLLAMLLGRAYERTGSILVPICFHACFNLNTLLVIALAPQIVQTSPA